MADEKKLPSICVEIARIIWSHEWQKKAENIQQGEYGPVIPNISILAMAFADRVLEIMEANGGYDPIMFALELHKAYLVETKNNGGLGIEHFQRFADSITSRKRTGGKGRRKKRSKSPKKRTKKRSKSPKKRSKSPKKRTKKTIKRSKSPRKRKSKK